MKPIILLVEDNPDHELLAMRALSRNGVANDIVVARDGAEAPGLGFRNGGAQRPRHLAATASHFAGFETAEDRWAGSIATPAR